MRDVIVLTILSRAAALKPLRFTVHERYAGGRGFGPALNSSEEHNIRRRLGSTGALLGDIALTTVSGTRAFADGQTIGSAKTLPIGENVYGPFEAGFGTAQDNVITMGLGCSTASLCYSEGGVDTALAEALCAYQCGITLCVPWPEHDVACVATPSPH